MNKAPLLRAAPLALLVALAACNSHSETATNSADATADANAATPAAPIELPPPLLASRTFRCKDNSLLYIDFYGGEKTADLRATKDGSVTKLTAPEAGQPLTGGGYSVSGTGTQVTITQPDKPSQSCKA